jgi:hypothetical protein
MQCLDEISRDYISEKRLDFQHYGFRQSVEIATI